MTEVARKIDFKQYPGVEWSVCLELTGNNEQLAVDLLTMFTNSLPDEMQILKTAFSNSDYETLRTQAHKMHGALCYCGIPSLKIDMLELEKSCLAYELGSANDSHRINECYRNVEQKIGALLDYISG